MHDLDAEFVQVRSLQLRMLDMTLLEAITSPPGPYFDEEESSPGLNVSQESQSDSIFLKLNQRGVECGAVCTSTIVLRRIPYCMETETKNLRLFPNFSMEEMKMEIFFWCLTEFHTNLLLFFFN